MILKTTSDGVRRLLRASTIDIASSYRPSEI
jgi:hypothetical protein